MTTRSAFAEPAALFPRPLIVTVLVLASTPLWLKGVGLYQYLALEIMIWMLFALGHNLLLGYAGLPSFGHGAYFGIGAYTIGLLQHRADAGLLGGLLGAGVVAALFGARVAACSSHRRASAPRVASSSSGPPLREKSPPTKSRRTGPALSRTGCVRRSRPTSKYAGAAPGGMTRTLSGATP